MPAPTNDNFANATFIDLTSPGSVAGTTFDATKEATEPAYVTNDQSVWYFVTPSTTGWYRFWIESTDQIDHNGRGLGLTWGTATTLAGFTRTAADSDVQNNDSFTPVGDWTVAGFLTSGVTYYIKIYASKPGTINAQTSDFTLRWTSFTPPANNDFANAQTLTLPASVSVDTKDATMEVNEPLFSGGFYTGVQSRWYKFTTAAAGWHRMRLVQADFVHTGNHLHGIIDGSQQNPGIFNVQVFNSSVTTLAGATEANQLAIGSIGINDTRDAIVMFNAPSAATYYVRVYTPYIKKEQSDGITYCFNDQTASTTLQFEAISPPSNDNFANAITLSTTLPGTLSASTWDSTQEATEPDVFSSGSNIEQSIWYKFTPSVTGLYRFRILLPSIIYHGYQNSSSGQLDIGIWNQTSLVNITTANRLDYDEGYPILSGWSIYNRHDPEAHAVLTSGVTYYIKVASPFGTILNRSTCDFTLEWDLLPVPANDDFANAQAISGASGTYDFSAAAAATYQTAGSEPPSNYYNDPQTLGTIWFDWTCPATGDYKFKVASTEIHAKGTFDLAVWTGSALNALTKVVRNWQGSAHDITLPSYGSFPTTVGFHAIAGTHYKIQIGVWEATTQNLCRLSWTTNTVTGNTTGTALSPVQGRMDNHGNVDTEPPPNAITRLSAHDSFWFTTGAVGKCKWYKVPPGIAQTVGIYGHAFEGDPFYSQNHSVPDAVCLLVYKGANYASLTNAATTIAQGSKDAAMMLESVQNAESATWSAYLTNVDGTIVHMQVPITASETLWICVFGMYDSSYAGSTQEDASEFELDLFISTSAPPNDVLTAVPSTHEYFLSRSEWDGSYSYPDAGARDGITAGATADVGELAHAGFGPTRSVWYKLDIGYTNAGTYRIWVESAQDCVLSVYTENFPAQTIGALVSIAEDDDSGTGNWPQVELFLDDTDSYWIAVDSKTDASFTLKWKRLSAGTPPANDDWANAQNLASFPINVSGTTVNATAEPYERENESMSWGPTDTVWYKWTATFTGHIKVTATCNSTYYDADIYVDIWKGSTLQTLVRAIEPPNPNKGWFDYYHPEDINKEALTLDVVNGTTYYFRIQTFSGGSEDFTLYLDVAETYINIQASGSEEMHGTLIDSAEIYVNIQVSSVEDYHAATGIDASEIYVNIQPGSPNEFMAHDYFDVATVRVTVGIDSHDCQSTWDPSQLTAYCRRRYEANSNGRWNGTMCYRRFEAIAGDGLEEC